MISLLYQNNKNNATPVTYKHTHTHYTGYRSKHCLSLARWEPGHVDLYKYRPAPSTDESWIRWRMENVIKSPIMFVRFVLRVATFYAAHANTEHLLLWTREAKAYEENSDRI